MDLRHIDLTAILYYLMNFEFTVVLQCRARELLRLCVVSDGPKQWLCCRINNVIAFCLNKLLTLNFNFNMKQREPNT